MSFVYIEGFDNFAVNQDLRDEGWQSTRSDGAILGSTLTFYSGRLNERSFGKNVGSIGTDGFGRAIPPAIGRNLHMGFSFKDAGSRESSSWSSASEVNSLIVTGMTTASNGSLKPILVVSYMHRSRRFVITSNTNTNITNPSSTAVSQRSFYSDAPDWFDPTAWNYFELIVTNNGNEAYLYCNGEAVASNIDTGITYGTAGFTFFYFLDFPNRVQWSYPVHSPIGNGEFSGNALGLNGPRPRYDDVFIKQSTALATPLGDFRINDGSATADFSVEFTPTVGSLDNFSNLDELTADGDISVVSSDTPTKTDLYSHSVQLSPVVVPNTVTVKTRVVAKNAVIAPVVFSGIISDGLVTVEGGPYLIGTTYGYHSLTYNTDANGVPWTKTTAEATLFGFTHKP